jgi:hypothetical protein
MMAYTSLYQYMDACGPLTYFVDRWVSLCTPPLSVPPPPSPATPFPHTPRMSLSWWAPSWAWPVTTESSWMHTCPYLPTRNSWDW